MFFFVYWTCWSHFDRWFISQMTATSVYTCIYNNTMLGSGHLILTRGFRKMWLATLKNITTLLRLHEKISNSPDKKKSTPSSSYFIYTQIQLFFITAIKDVCHWGMKKFNPLPFQGLKKIQPLLGQKYSNPPIFHTPLPNSIKWLLPYY